MYKKETFRKYFRPFIPKVFVLEYNRLGEKAVKDGEAMSRTLYLIAYDISNERRLHAVHNFLKGYSTGGQKSVYECFLTDGELGYVKEALKDIIDEKEDRIHIFVVDGRSKTHTLGIAIAPRDPAYFYVG